MQLDLVDRELVDGLLDDPYFNPLFIQDGYAVLLQSRLVCVPGEDAQFEFSIEFIETEQTLAEQGLEGPNGYTCRTGNSSYSQSPEALIIEAVTVEGPFRASLLHYESLDRLRRGLSDLIGHSRKQLEEAAASPNAIFDRTEVEWCADHLRSADRLLADLYEDWERHKDDPEIARFLEMPTPSDCPSLH
jgi:hypothetical protein